MRSGGPLFARGPQDGNHCYRLSVCVFHMSDGTTYILSEHSYNLQPANDNISNFKFGCSGPEINSEMCDGHESLQYNEVLALHQLLLPLSRLDNLHQNSICWEKFLNQHSIAQTWGIPKIFKSSSCECECDLILSNGTITKESCI